MQSEYEKYGKPMKKIIAFKRDLQGNCLSNAQHACPYGERPLELFKLDL